MIPPGIPPDRAHWPDGLLEHLQKFRQGDLVEAFPVLYLGDPAVPVHAQTLEYSGEAIGVIEFSIDFPYGMITTQTCDLREEESKRPRRPWVQMSPVYDARTRYQPDDRSAPEQSFIHGGDRKLIRAGRGPQYLKYLPDFGDSNQFWVVDFRLSVPVDKGWLLGRTPIKAFATELERREIGRQCAAIHERPALDGRFVEAIQRPTVSALHELAKANAELFGSVYDEVYAIAVRSSDNVHMPTTEVWVISAGTGLSVEVRAWMDDLEAQWASLASAQDLIFLPVQHASLEGMSAAEYVTLTVVPLRNISPDPPWWLGATLSSDSG